MPRKLTYEFVKSQFEEEGYVCISKEYCGAESLLKLKCPNNHIFLLSWQKWLTGRRCKYCNRSVHIDTVRQSFALEGYTLLSDKYISSKHKLDFICNNGHTHAMSWSNWLKGRRCKKCFFNSVTTNKDIVFASIKEEGYTILSKLPKNFGSKTMFLVRCDRGHNEYYTTCNRWCTGYRCKECGYEHLSCLYRHDYIFIKESMAKENYILISEEYRNAFSKLEIKCPVGHVYFGKWREWRNGNRCPICANIKHSIEFSGPNHPNWKGGISSEPYCQDWNKGLKEYIKQRDSYKCMNPSCDSKNPNDLTVHHVDYTKKNCSLENLITVCRSCNIKANKDRSWHKAWYQAILNKRYGYIY